ncbi:MAG TPA: polysaccharide deacetylase family protein [Bacteroidales bacterium]|nr:polysaccharide deacetylase family protein [Bacteroidales bacterium]
MTKKTASISLDLDNQWSYMKIHGDEGWESYPSYLDIFVPYVLDILDELQLKITFFIVGQDAALEKNQKYLKMIAERGHEIGNHSFHHESWLQTYSKEEIEKEIIQAEEAIERVTGKRTKGFRGPGFSWSPDLLNVLKNRGYTFDASTLPTYIGPLARMYYFWTSNLSKEEKKERKELFGSFKEGFRPLKPYLWSLNNRDHLLEIPVTTIPIVKIPFHLSYLLYLSSYSRFLMKMYLYKALFLCKLTNTQPSYLLHPLDLIGGDQIPQLAFFPGMNVSSKTKKDVFVSIIKILQKNYKLVPMGQHAETLMGKKLRKIAVHKKTN